MTSSVVGAMGHLPAAWSSDALRILLLVLIAAGATLVVLCRQPARQAVLVSLYGAVLAMGFFALQAPDVTLSEVTVGAVLLPLLLVLTLAKLKTEPEKPDERRHR